MRWLGWLIAVPLALIVIAFAVANRGVVPVHFDPLPWVLDIPIWALAVGALAIGLLVGGLVQWLQDHKWRRMARGSQRRQRALEREAQGLRAKLERQAAARALPPEDAA